VSWNTLGSPSREPPGYSHGMQSSVVNLLGTPCPLQRAVTSRGPEFEKRQVRPLSRADPEVGSP
jgi:hypothetical protein